MKNQFKGKMAGALERGAFVILCAILIHGTFGVIINIGEMSLWATLFIGLFIFSLWSMLKNIPLLFRQKYFWILVLFGIWTAVCVVKGVVAGNNYEIIKRDIGGIIYFITYPVFFCLVNSKKRAESIMKCIMYASFALSIVHILCIVLFLHFNELGNRIFDLFISAGILNFTRISETIPRFLFVSSPFLLCGCAFPIYFQHEEKKNSWIYPVITGTCLFAIVMTFTRALYLAAFLAAVLILALMMPFSEKPICKKLALQIVASVMVCIVCLGTVSVMGATNYPGYALKRVFAKVSATEEASGEVLSAEEKYLQDTISSDVFRQSLVKELHSKIQEAPITGNGMGIKFESKKDFPEYSYLDLWAKMGIIGVILYFSPVLMLAGSVVCNLVKRKKILLMSGTWLAVIAGLMVYSYFQPFMNNTVFVILYCCALCVHEQECRIPIQEV